MTSEYYERKINDVLTKYRSTGVSLVDQCIEGRGFLYNASHYG